MRYNVLNLVTTAFWAYVRQNAFIRLFLYCFLTVFQLQAGSLKQQDYEHFQDYFLESADNTTSYLGFSTFNLPDNEKLQVQINEDGEISSVEVLKLTPNGDLLPIEYKLLIQDKVALLTSKNELKYITIDTTLIAKSQAILNILYIDNTYEEQDGVVRQINNSYALKKKKTFWKISKITHKSYTDHLLKDRGGKGGFLENLFFLTIGLPDLFIIAPGVKIFWGMKKARGKFVDAVKIKLEKFIEEKFNNESSPIQFTEEEITQMAEQSVTETQDKLKMVYKTILNLNISARKVFLRRAIEKSLTSDPEVELLTKEQLLQLTDDVLSDYYECLHKTTNLSRVKRCDNTLMRSLYPRVGRSILKIKLDEKMGPLLSPFEGGETVYKSILSAAYNTYDQCSANRYFEVYDLVLNNKGKDAPSWDKIVQACLFKTIINNSVIALDKILNLNLQKYQFEEHDITPYKRQIKQCYQENGYVFTDEYKHYAVQFESLQTIENVSDFTDNLDLCMQKILLSFSPHLVSHIVKTHEAIINAFKQSTYQEETIDYLAQLASADVLDKCFSLQTNIDPEKCKPYVFHHIIGHVFRIKVSEFLIKEYVPELKITDIFEGITPDNYIGSTTIPEEFKKIYTEYTKTYQLCLQNKEVEHQLVNQLTYDNFETEIDTEKINLECLAEGLYIFSSLITVNKIDQFLSDHDNSSIPLKAVIDQSIIDDTVEKAGQCFKNKILSFQKISDVNEEKMNLLIFNCTKETYIDLAPELASKITKIKMEQIANKPIVKTFGIDDYFLKKFESSDGEYLNTIEFYQSLASACFLKKINSLVISDNLTTKVANFTQDCTQELYIKAVKDTGIFAIEKILGPLLEQQYLSKAINRYQNELPSIMNNTNIKMDKKLNLILYKSMEIAFELLMQNTAEKNNIDLSISELKDYGKIGDNLTWLILHFKLFKAKANTDKITPIDMFDYAKLIETFSLTLLRTKQEFPFKYQRGVKDLVNLLKNIRDHESVEWFVKMRKITKFDQILNNVPYSNLPFYPNRSEADKLNLSRYAIAQEFANTELFAPFIATFLSQMVDENAATFIGPMINGLKNKDLEQVTNKSVTSIIDKALFWKTDDIVKLKKMFVKSVINNNYNELEITLSQILANNFTPQMLEQTITKSGASSNLKARLLKNIFIPVIYQEKELSELELFDTELASILLKGLLLDRSKDHLAYNLSAAFFQLKIDNIFDSKVSLQVLNNAQDFIDLEELKKVENFLSFPSGKKAIEIFIDQVIMGTFHATLTGETYDMQNDLETIECLIKNAAFEYAVMVGKLTTVVIKEFTWPSSNKTTMSFLFSDGRELNPKSCAP